MTSVKELVKIAELQRLMPFTPDYYCEKCGVALTKPVIRVFGHHILGGSPMLAGEFKCPNQRWWNIGHTVLHLEYVGCNLNVFNDGKHFEKLWAHKLEEQRADCTKAGKAE